MGFRYGAETTKKFGREELEGILAEFEWRITGAKAEIFVFQVPHPPLILKVLLHFYTLMDHLWMHKFFHVLIYRISELSLVSSEKRVYVLGCHYALCPSMYRGSSLKWLLPPRLSSPLLRDACPAGGNWLILSKAQQKQVFGLIRNR